MRRNSENRPDRKKLTKSKRRREEISGLIKKLYEAYATGKIPENHFSELLTGYDTEQKTLDGEIEKLQTEIERYNTDSIRADKFIELVKRHTEFPEFSASLLNEFVEKVIVLEATKKDGVREQEETPVRKSRKKLRRNMTEEELKRAREIDHKRYAQKVAAKLKKSMAAFPIPFLSYPFQTRNRKEILTHGTDEN